MGVAVLKSTLDGGYTPICNNCGVTLCWDISSREYLEAEQFWDGWRCEECDPNVRGSLERYKNQRSK